MNVLQCYGKEGDKTHFTAALTWCGKGFYGCFYNLFLRCGENEKGTRNVTGSILEKICIFANSLDDDPLLLGWQYGSAL